MHLKFIGFLFGTVLFSSVAFAKAIEPSERDVDYFDRARHHEAGTSEIETLAQGEREGGVERSPKAKAGAAEGGFGGRSGGAPSGRDWSKIDADKDNYISPEEMDAWLKANPGPLRKQ